MKRDEDFKLLEQYQSLSAEVLRLSLLAIGAVGALYTLKPGEAPATLGSFVVKVAFVLGLLCFGISIAFSLLHRYWATDFLACQISLDRLREQPPLDLTPERLEARIKSEKLARKRASVYSKLTIAGGPLFLAIGAGFLAVGFGLVVGLRH